MLINTKSIKLLAIAVLITTVAVMATTQSIPLVEADKVVCSGLAVCEIDKSKTKQNCKAKDFGLVTCSIN